MRYRFDEADIHSMRDALLTWYAQSKRDLPWRKTRDPYAIWLSETMLQQTRVSAVIPYYEKFLRRFPTIAALATAPEADLLSAWAGLGYYYRARNLQKAAQLIAANGSFPDTYDAVRALPGVGEYTAAAVASIAFNLPHAVVDGNVLRVLSRVAADSTNVASTAGRKHFTARAQDFLDSGRPSCFNQAMMELGATICLPRNPQCLLCPLSRHCKARQLGTQESFPVKSARLKSTDEERTVFWIEHERKVLAWQRPSDSRLMPGFWELPEPEQVPEISRSKEIGLFRHAITTHNYRFTVRRANPPVALGVCRWIEVAKIDALPVSTILKKAFRLIGAETRRASETSGLRDSLLKSR